MRMPVAVAVLGMASGVAAAGAFDPLSNVCLLTIMTQERLASLHRMLLSWDGWVSIAMLVEADEYASLAGAGPDMALRYRGRSVAAPERVALALVSDVGYRAPSNRFPYNLLRNAALRGCEATYVFAADVDFVPYPVRPSARLRSRLEELEVRPGSKNVLVVAAFEQVGPRPSEAEGAALDKPALRQLVGSGDLISFASAVYERGHECDQASVIYCCYPCPAGTNAATSATSSARVAVAVANSTARSSHSRSARHPRSRCTPSSQQTRLLPLSIGLGASPTPSYLAPTHTPTRRPSWAMARTGSPGTTSWPPSKQRGTWWAPSLASPLRPVLALSRAL